MTGNETEPRLEIEDEARGRDRQLSPERKVQIDPNLDWNSIRRDLLSRRNKDKLDPDFTKSLTFVNDILVKIGRRKRAGSEKWKEILFFMLMQNKDFLFHAVNCYCAIKKGSVFLSDDAWDNLLFLLQIAEKKYSKNNNGIEENDTQPKKVSFDDLMSVIDLLVLKVGSPDDNFVDLENRLKLTKKFGSIYDSEIALDADLILSELQKIPVFDNYQALDELGARFDRALEISDADGVNHLVAEFGLSGTDGSERDKLEGMIAKLEAEVGLDEELVEDLVGGVFPGFKDKIGRTTFMIFMILVLLAGGIVIASQLKSDNDPVYGPVPTSTPMIDQNSLPYGPVLTSTPKTRSEVVPTSTPAGQQPENDDSFEITPVSTTIK